MLCTLKEPCFSLGYNIRILARKCCCMYQLIQEPQHHELGGRFLPKQKMEMCNPFPEGKKAAYILQVLKNLTHLRLSDYPSKWVLTGQDQTTVTIQTALASVTDIIWRKGPFLENLTPIWSGQSYPFVPPIAVTDQTPSNCCIERHFFPLYRLIILNTVIYSVNNITYVGNQY
jgi:hypothetical protein